MSIFHGKLEEITRDTFDVIHSYFYLDKKREHDFEICAMSYVKHPIYKSNFNSNKSDLKEYRVHICLPILHKAISLLIYHNYTDFDTSCVLYEFHRRNYLSFGKKTPHKDIIWHYDDMAVSPYKVYSIIFYLRKDKTINGGGLLYDTEKIKGVNIEKIDVSQGDYVLFPGNIYHSPEPSYGFGCRDSIVVFIRRK